jgi:serine/threonine-protein kinase ULK/ATG1
MFIKKRDKLATHPATHDMARKYPSAQNSGLHEVIVRHFLKQLASALEFLRQKNYVHRDVKPQNLLLLPSQSFRSTRSFNIMEASQDSLIPIAGLRSLPMLKLADFGFARVLPSTSLADTLCGSPLYMAPEILRYERYDAKADLWSVGTVLYEMTTGKPPFRARNHVELLRKIEAAEDVIKFPREVSVGSEIKGLIRSLLKRSPVERLSFENFFVHPVVTSDIPGLVEDDVPRPPKQELRAIQPRESVPSSARPSTSPSIQGDERTPEAGSSRSPREVQGRAPQQVDSPGEGRNQRPSGIAQRLNGSPREVAEGLGIQRPQAHHTASLPTRPEPYRSLSRDVPSVSAAQAQETRNARASSGRSAVEEDKAAQDVMFERDYVVVERRQVEVNALADELAANEKLGSPSPTSPRSTGMSRRYTQQGAPTSTTGAIPTPASQTALVAQGRGSHDRRSSYEKALSGSPSSASSAISKAIQDASLRLFGFKVSTGGAKGSSPPMYHAFPAYPPPSQPIGSLGDGREHHGDDENASAAQAIEDFATRSDCVYGFAEVKYKQLVPLAPSMDHGIGGVEAEQLSGDEDGLTIEAIVSLSEESLVLYVKSLSLLAKAMDIASMWWAQKSRVEATNGIVVSLSQNDVKRINAVVQWVRQRFNEVLEKSEIVRLKLIDAQKKLPEDHPSHPSNLDSESTTSSGGPSWKPVHLTPGISAEKLMYDRALEMSRAAAIDEVTNENLPGCELSYITAIRMLEAVLDTPDESAIKKLPSAKSSGKETLKQSSGDLDSDEEAHVRKSKT